MKTLTGYEERIQEENPNSQPSTTEKGTPFTVEEIPTDPTREGFVMIPNYFKDYWQALLGTDSAATFELLKRYCYGSKDECFPSIERMAASLKLDRHRITGRRRIIRRDGQVVKDYHEEGTLDKLQKYGLLEIEKTGSGRRTRYHFKIVKDVPLLTPEQVAQLPKILQESHQRLLGRCQVKSQKWVNFTCVNDTSKSELHVSMTQQPCVNDTTNKTTEQNKAFNNNNPVVASQKTLNRLSSLFQNDKTISRLIRTYPIDHIDKQLNLTEEGVKQGKLKNPPGFFLDAIENNYESPESAISRLTRKGERMEAEARKKKAEEVREKEEAEAKRQKEIEKQIQSIPPADKALWDKTLAILKKDMDPQIFNIFLRETRPYFRTKQKITLWVPGEHYKDFLEENYLPQIKQAWAALSGFPAKVEFVT